MKSNTFSIVVGDDKCNANCPYCVAKMTEQVSTTPGLNLRRLETACKIAQQAADGFCTAMITGKGEPMLHPDQIEQVLQTFYSYDFPVIELQTNGILIEKYRDKLTHWHAMGLDLVSISIADTLPATNNHLMGISGVYNYTHAVRTLQEIGFSVRLNVTMTRQGLHTTSDFQQLMTNCYQLKVDQVTLREVTKTNCYGKVAEWVQNNNVDGFTDNLIEYIEMCGGTRLLELPHGGVVYDLNGQNVCLTNCLTGSSDPNNTRQIIYFPDGRIMYDWCYAGARIL
jgi:molybdenum cofactor biosynthesis enzyme MoaA